MNTSDGTGMISESIVAQHQISPDEKEHALIVRGVHKRFKLFDNPITGPIKQFLFFWRNDTYFREVAAVEDVTFTLTKGEVVGIVGQNGAGKTTLLKMIAGLLSVDHGTISVQGTVTALLALGITVHPEFSGRENIYLGGILLGMSKDEIAAKEAEIIDFAELGEYIDHPLRTYSSGMRSRLLFSISMSIEPDILIVDEALATGDAYFVQKCLIRINELCKIGATILFVTHNIRQIEEICERCLVLEKGRLVYDGPVRQAINEYVGIVEHNSSVKLSKKTRRDRINRIPQGTGEIILEDAYFEVDDARTNSLPIGKDCNLIVEFNATKVLKNVTISLEIFSTKSTTTYSFVQPIDFGAPELTLNSFNVLEGRQKLTISFSNIAIGDGTYECGFHFYPSDIERGFSYETCFCSHDGFLSFQAYYLDKRAYGRGTLCEIPISNIRVEKK